MNRSRIMVTCLPSSGRGGRFISSSDANQLISEGSAHRINSLTIQLNARDDMPKTDDESCRMGPNVTECFADGMEWARVLTHAWNPALSEVRLGCLRTVVARGIE
jgi:hypothetical protein